jgi:hypothetical protein
MSLAPQYLTQLVQSQLKAGNAGGHGQEETILINIYAVHQGLCGQTLLHATQGMASLITGGHNSRCRLCVHWVIVLHD